MKYAKGTTVTENKSQQEIENLLTRFAGGELERFAYMTSSQTAEICFVIRKMTFRMQVWLPKIEDFKYTSKSRQRRTDKAAKEVFQAERRRRWRSLAAVIKAKLIAIEDQVATFEEEFLPYMVTDTGETIAARLLPSVRVASMDGHPLMLPMLLEPRGQS